MTGTTRMRVTAKMSNLGGHTAPTPCDNPPDALGYHGEMEDYEVNIVNTVGIAELASPITAMELQPNPSVDMAFLSYTLTEALSVGIDLLDATGRQVMSIANDDQQAPGEHHIRVGGGGTPLVNGLYFVRVQAGDHAIIRRLVIDGR